MTLDLPGLPLAAATCRRGPGRGARAGAALVGVVVVLVVVVPFVTPPPDAVDGTARLQPPSLEHPLGTDRFGRDQLARVAAGGRRSLLAATAAVGVALAVGVAAGCALALLGRAVDAVGSRILDAALAVPGLLLALALLGALGPGTVNLVVAVALSLVAPYTRLARGLALATRGRPDVVVARLAGVSRARVLAGHVLPAVGTRMVVVGTLELGGVVGTVAGLSYLGLGVAPPQAEWGGMLQEGGAHLATAPWLVVGPGGALLVTVIAANLLGEALQETTR